jgi:hypothetical protein
MSNVTVPIIYSPNKRIDVVSGTTLYSPGTVLQTVNVRSDARPTYSLLATGDGSSITQLGLTVVPKFSTSLLLMMWTINYEVSYNMVFSVFKDGALITTSGYESYNSYAGNQRWSGFAAGMYNEAGNTDSTPSHVFIQYADLAGSTASRTYTPLARTSDATALSFLLNRSAGAVGQDNYENMISTGILMEIAQ